MSHAAPSLTAELSLRSYAGEYAAHAHDHAQVLFGFDGRLEMELGGRLAYVDPSCGLVIPAGTSHAFMSPTRARVLVLDAPMQGALARMRRFAITRRHAALAEAGSAEQALAEALRAPRILARRGLDLAQLDAQLEPGLHEAWSTARMAQVFSLSPQRFHARLLEWTGQTPQQYLRTRRLDRAAAHLRTGMSLEATALQVGYRSASALVFALRRDRNQTSRALRASVHR